MPMEGSASASAEGAESPANARPKRSRTGCMTCRNRRRKCDEGKPVCQNCISKGFECRYAAAFQILGKHNFTPEIETDVRYANVRFAGDDVEESVPVAVAQSAITARKGHGNLPVQTQSVVSRDIPAASSSVDTSGQGISGHTPSPNSYEFALHGLLALGSTSGITEGAGFPSVPTIDEAHAVSSYDFASNGVLNTALDGSSIQRRPEAHRTQTGHQSNLGFDTVGHGTPDLSPSFQQFEHRDGLGQVHRASNSSATVRTETSLVSATATGHSLELLQFFRYQIAPWLDICDSEQHFGVTLLTESTHIPSLRASILQLSAASSKIAWVSGGSDIGRSAADGNAKHNTVSDTIVKTVVDLMHVLADALPNLATFWREKDKGAIRINLLEELLLQLNSSGLSTCAYWLLIRLKLSRALMAGDDRIPLPPLANKSGRNETNDLLAHCAYDAIALCVDACMFAQGDDDHWLQQRYGLNRVEVWKILIQSFAHWYMRRPQEFQPIIDLYPKDGVLTEDDYPTIVFTSGSALLANQLYHTGMLLLLQHKPRFANKPSQNSPSMSTLWHAHRVCGIAIQNDRHSWWDPCLVASLIVAGRTATHASQHIAIVSTLESVQRLTGWTVDAYVDQLRSEWQLAESS